MHRERFLDIVDGRVDSGGMTKMKDITLKGKSGVPGEQITNKIQDFQWDDVLSEHCQLPKVCIVFHLYPQDQNFSLTSVLSPSPILPWK